MLNTVARLFGYRKDHPNGYQPMDEGSSDSETGGTTLSRTGSTTTCDSEEISISSVDNEIAAIPEVIQKTVIASSGVVGGHIFSTTGGFAHYSVDTEAILPIAISHKFIAPTTNIFARDLPQMLQLQNLLKSELTESSVPEKTIKELYLLYVQGLYELGSRIKKSDAQDTRFQELFNASIKIAPTLNEDEKKEYFTALTAIMSLGLQRISSQFASDILDRVTKKVMRKVHQELETPHFTMVSVANKIYKNPLDLESLEVLGSYLGLETFRCAALSDEQARSPKRRFLAKDQKELLETVGKDPNFILHPHYRTLHVLETELTPSERKRVIEIINEEVVNGDGEDDLLAVNPLPLSREELDLLSPIFAQHADPEQFEGKQVTCFYQSLVDNQQKISRRLTEREKEVFSKVLRTNQDDGPDVSMELWSIHLNSLLKDGPLPRRIKSYSASLPFKTRLFKKSVFETALSPLIMQLQNASKKADKRRAANNSLKECQTHLRRHVQLLTNREVNDKLPPELRASRESITQLRIREKELINEVQLAEEALANCAVG